MTAGPGITIHASKEKHSDGKFRILSLKSKYLETWNKSCANVSEPNCTMKFEGPTFHHMRSLFLQNLQCLEAFEEDMPWKPVIERAKTSDRKHAVRTCCHSRIALFPRARNWRTFQPNWQVDIFTFQQFIKPRVGGRGPLKKFLQALSLSSSP